jgi:D-alanyl-D-alanine carboxypeptidase
MNWMKGLILSAIGLSAATWSAAQIRLNKEEVGRQVDSIFSSIYTRADEPGAAVLIKQGDKTIFEKCYGVEDMSTMKPITPYTRFNIASVSKQFSAVAILQLAEQGKLSLNDNLKKFFPEFKADFFKRITLHHLLSHTSGLCEYHPCQDSDYVFKATDIESCRYLKDLDKLHFEPGTRYEYINMTFQLIYQIIPKVTGISFDDYMRRYVFDKAGMHHSTYFEADKVIPHAAHAYSFDKKKGRYVENDYGEARFFATKADGGLYTTIRDFARWEKALRTDKVLSAASRELAYTPHVMIPKDADYGYNKYTGYGYGFFIQQIPGWPKIVYHLGDNGGFTIYAGKIPDDNITVMFFSNRDDIDRIGTADKIYHILLKK